jgi:divinyl protochlorophyllide a 8-vinyl-reductase
MFTQESRIGPNAVVQTLRALEALEGPEPRARVARAAELPEVTLDGLVPEAWFVRLVDALRDELPPPRAEAILARAGTWTAAYVAERRVPKAFRQLLGWLPPRLGLPLLLEAFRRHAWTFAGSGRYAVHGRYPGRIALEGSPTCRPRTEAGADSTLGGAYYEAAFEGLLRLAAPAARVREVACMRRGASACCFEIALAAPAGEPEGALR